MKRMVLLAVPLLLSACGDPEWVAVYEECKQKAGQQAAEIQSASKESAAGEDERTRAMINSMSQMTSAMVLGACEMIRSTCEADPDGAACQAMIEHPRQ